MSNSVKDFRNLLTQRTDLQARLLNGENYMDVAREEGFTFTQTEFEQFVDSVEELSDFELEAVSGGDKCVGGGN